MLTKKVEIMKSLIHKMLIIMILSVLLPVSANAWGKREQGILIGAGLSALLLPSLMSPSNNRYYDSRNYYYDRYGRDYYNSYSYYGNNYYDRYYAKPKVEYVKPKVTYITPPTTNNNEPVVTTTQPATMKHRQQKEHVYINKVNPSDTVVIEYSDGTKTIIEGR